MNKTLVITGASQGIGKETAQLFSEQGWRVVNLSRNHCDLPGVKNLCIDLTQAEALSSQQAELLEGFEETALICIVHNAASYAKDSMAQLDSEDLRSILELNIVSPVALNQLFISRMAKGSSIIYIGSTLSEKAVAGNASYVISKHASVGMMRATCQDLAQQQIHSCCICPGFTETEMLKKHLRNDAALLNAIKGRVGADRLIQPSEIASLIFYAAEHPILNGSVLHANLGQVER